MKDLPEVVVLGQCAQSVVHDGVAHDVLQGQDTIFIFKKAFPQSMLI